MVITINPHINSFTIKTKQFGLARDNRIHDVYSYFLKKKITYITNLILETASKGFNLKQNNKCTKRGTAHIKI